MMAQRDPEDEPEARAGTTFALEIPAPSPARTSTAFQYSVPSTFVDGSVNLSVFDLSGRLVRELRTGPSQPGTHVVGWDLRDRDGKSVRAGLYFVRLASREQKFTRSIVVAR